MLYSESHKILFIAIPKTGTTSVEKALSELISDAELHTITLRGKTYKGEEFHQGMLGHARAKEIRDGIGYDNYNSLRSFAFIRNPYSKLVSAYFFNKKRNLFSFLNMKGSKNMLMRKAKDFLSAFSARILPFQVWMLIYPYRSNYDYIFDDNGEKIVDYIGRTEFLESDLNNILKLFHVKCPDIKVQKLNTSNHTGHKKYYSIKFLKKIIDKRLEKDLELYNTISFL